MKRKKLLETFAALLGAIVVGILLFINYYTSAQIDQICTHTGTYYLPQPADEGVTRFAIIGDYGENNEGERAVAELVNSWQPQFIVTVGDNNYPSGEAETIDENIGQYYSDYIGNYQGKYGEGAVKNRFFPALGNHDWDTNSAKPYLDYFTLPGNERYYDFVKGPIHFFVLDSDSKEPDGIRIDSKQADWLRAQIATSTAPFKIVVSHHPPLSSGVHGSSSALRWNYADLSVDAVISGHEHSYERLEEDGVSYIINGIGAGLSRPFNPLLESSQAQYNCSGGAMLVEATQSTLRMRLITPDNLVVDDFTLTAREKLTSTSILKVAMQRISSLSRYQNRDSQ